MDNANPLLIVMVGIIVSLLGIAFLVFVDETNTRITALEQTLTDGCVEVKP